MKPFYFSGAEGQIYSMFLPAVGEARGALLWLPPFAEEAHCARRHMVVAAREAQQGGYASLFIDPYGTGESEGDFSQASWPVWLSDVEQAAAWLRARAAVPLWLLGVRAGSLLAAAAVAAVEPEGVLCWQPVSAGRNVVDGLLRLKLIAGWGEAASGSAILADARAELALGRAVEAGGFVLPAALARDLEASGMSWSPASCPRLASIEFRSRQHGGGAGHTPGFARQCESWRGQGLQLASLVREAPQFWLVHEAPLTRGLGEASVALIGQLPEEMR